MSIYRQFMTPHVLNQVVMRNIVSPKNFLLYNIPPSYIVLNYDKTDILHILPKRMCSLWVFEQVILYV
jgi:hypothetical protein